MINYLDVFVESLMILIHRWEDYPVQIQDRRRWRGCRVRMGIPPPEVNRTEGGEVGKVQ